MAILLGFMVVGPARAGDMLFAVTSSNPPNFALIQPPPNITFTFNEDVDPTSLSKTNLTINGQNATGFVLIDAHTVLYTLPPLPSGERVNNPLPPLASRTLRVTPSREEPINKPLPPIACAPL